MPAISANNITYLRQPYHRVTNFKLNLFELDTVATATINQAVFTYPLLELTIDNASAGYTSANVRFAMFDVTDSGEIVYRGVIRAIPSGTTDLEMAYIVEGDCGLMAKETLLSLADNQDITVYKTRTPFAFLSRIDSGTDRILKRGDDTFNPTFPQTVNIQATGIIGSHQQANADPITGEASFTIDASGSYSWIGGTLSFVHTLDTGMSIVSGTTTDASIVIKGTAGQYLHQVRVEDSLNPTAYNRFNWRYLFINDDTIYPAFSDRYATVITSDVHTKTGRQVTFTSYAQGAVDKLYVGAPVVMTYDVETSADGVTWDTLEDSLGRRTFSGYVKRIDEIRNDVDEVIGVSFLCQNVLDYADALPIANQYMQGNDTPTYWQETPYEFMHIAYWAYYILTINTHNIYNLHDYNYTDLDLFQRATVAMPAGDVKSAIQAMTNLAFANTGCTSDGTIYMSRNPVLESTAWRSALPTIWTFNDTDIRDSLEYARDYLHRVGSCEGKYTVFSGVTDSPYRGRWGAFAQAQGIAFEQMPDFIALSENDGLDRIGHRFAEINAPTPEINVKTRGLIGEFIEPVWGEWVGLNVGAYDPLASGMYDNARAVPLAVNRAWNFDSSYPTCEIDITCAPETFGTQATSVPFAVTNGGGSSAYSWSASFDFVFANGGFQAFVSPGGATGSYALSTGWGTVDIRPNTPTGNYFRFCAIYLTFATRTITNITMTYNLTKGTYDASGGINFQKDVSGAWNAGAPGTVIQSVDSGSLVNGTGLTQSWTGSASTTGISVSISSSVRTTASYSGSALITKIELSGIGSNPFTQSGILPLP